MLMQTRECIEHYVSRDARTRFEDVRDRSISEMTNSHSARESWKRDRRLCNAYNHATHEARIVVACTITTLRAVTNADRIE